MFHWDSLWTAGAAVAALGSLGLLVWQQLRSIKRQNEEQLRRQTEQRQRDDEFKLDWNGAPARPGVQAVPGVMARLQNIESNTASLPDRMTAVERRLDRSEADRVELHTRLDDHIKLHPPYGGV